MDGAAPSAYQAQRDQPGYQPKAPIYQPPTSQPVPPSYQSPPPEYQRPRPATQPPRRVQTYRAVVATHPPGVRMVRWIVFAVALMVLVGVGAGMFSAFSSSQGSDAGQGQITAVSGRLGAPASVEYRDADFRVTVDAATAQPVDGWSRGNAAPDPKLVIALDLTRLGSGPGTVTMMPRDWTFTPTEGPAADGELISGYQPELNDAALAAGAHASGLLTFDTGSDAGTLALKDPDRQDATVATWEIHATAPKVITGAVGKPAIGQLGAPAFTMTLAKPRWIPAGDDRLRGPVKIGAAGSGTALALTFTVKGIRDEYAGQVPANQIWFIPKGGKPVRAEYPGPLRDATVLVTVTDTEPQKLVVGFGVKQQHGTVELRDPTGKPVIRWQI
jgi:hypothetical protein